MIANEKSKDNKKKDGGLALDDSAAAVILQGMFRRWKARKSILAVMAQVYDKVFDGSSNAYYYYNKRTGESSWEAPRLLGTSTILDEVASVELPKKESFSVSKKEYSKDEAVSICQALWRRKKARARVVGLMRNVYEKVWDGNSQMHYFYNKNTGSSSWYAPTLGGVQVNVPEIVALPDPADDAASSGTSATMGVALDDFEKRAEPTIDQAASKIAALFRGRAQRARFRTLVSSTFEKILDTSSGYPFWYNARTGESTWEEPILLKKLQQRTEFAVAAQGSPAAMLRRQSRQG